MASESLSLPYIDLEYNDPELKKAVDQLILSELSTSPLPSFFHASSSSSSSFSSTPPKPLDAIDVSKYTRFPSPSSSSSSTNSTYSTNEDTFSDQYQPQTHLDLMYSLQCDRLDQLTLLQQHGKLAWLAHVHQLERYLEHLEKSKQKLDQSILDLHRQRKTEQLEAKANLDFLQHQIDTTKQSNLATLLAIQAMKKQSLS